MDFFKHKLPHEQQFTWDTQDVLNTQEVLSAT